MILEYALNYNEPLEQHPALKPKETELLNFLQL